MDFVQGRVLWDQSMPGMSNEKRAAYYDEMNRVIAQLHTIDYKAIGLESFGKPGNYFARQIDRWTKQYKASETEKIEAMDKLIEWLPAHIPPGDETSIVHGDYRPDNIVFHPTEPKTLAGPERGPSPPGCSGKLASHPDVQTSLPVAASYQATISRSRRCSMGAKGSPPVPAGARPGAACSPRWAWACGRWPGCRWWRSCGCCR